MIQIDTPFLIFFLGIVLAVIGWLLRDKFKRIDNKLLELKDKRDKETCDIIHKNIGDSIKNIEKEVNKLSQWELTNHNSPRKLKTEGEIIFKYSGIKELIDENIDDLFKEITNTNPRDYYEVEFQSEKIINKIKTETNLEKIKSCAERVNIPIEMLLFIGSVYLSNKYLEKYPELTKEDKENDK